MRCGPAPAEHALSVHRRAARGAVAPATMMLLLMLTLLTGAGADDPEDEAKPPPGDCQCADSSTLESGSDYSGNDILGERHAASVQECCELCLATPGCTCAPCPSLSVFVCWLDLPTPL